MFAVSSRGAGGGGSIVRCPVLGGKLSPVEVLFSDSTQGKSHNPQRRLSPERVSAVYGPRARISSVFVRLNFKKFLFCQGSGSTYVAATLLCLPLTFLMRLNKGARPASHLWTCLAHWSGSCKVFLLPLGFVKCLMLFLPLGFV